MSIDSRILDLVMQWEEQQELGQTPTPEELCRACPELLDPFRRALLDLQRAGRMLEPVQPPDGQPSVAASPMATVPDPQQQDRAAPPWLQAAGRYQPQQFHARGGLGEVHRAHDAELDRPVALKRIQGPLADDPLVRRRFLREAALTARLQHPGIVPVYGLVRDEQNRPCYAMRFVEGRSLKDAIEAFHQADRPGRDAGERNLAFRGLLARFVTVCKTIAYAHSRSVVHLDLKPGNVMLGDFDETLVVDWGLARFVGQEESIAGSDVGDEAEASRLEGQAAGTPAYMSPEQAQGRWQEVGPASDLFSLGATLYSLLTGRPPFASLEQARQCRFRRPSEVKPVPAALEAVCLKALAREAEQRYPGAQLLAEEVEHWLADEPVVAYREPVVARLRRWGRRHRMMVAGLAVLLLTATVALAVGLVVVNAEKQRTEQALQRSVKAEKSAREQRRLALETVQVVVHDIQDRLKDRPQMREMRQLLLARAGEKLKEVARTADMAGLIDREQLYIHVELGDIFRDLEVGGTAEAKHQYERALSLARQLVAAAPESGLAQHDLSATLGRLGDLQLRLGDTQAALESNRLSLEIGQRLADADPTNARAQQSLSAAQNRLGEVWLRLGNTKTALELFRLSQDLAKRLADADPTNALAQSRLSASHSKLGDMQLRLGNAKAALESYRLSLDLAKRLAEADPTNAQAQHTLSVTQERLSEVQLHLGDTQAALESNRLSLVIGQRLADADPTNARVQRDLAIHRSKQGDLQMLLSDTKAALESYRLSLEICQRLADADPTNAEAQRDLSAAQSRLGDLWLRLGNTKTALELFQISLNLDKRLADTDPKNTAAQRDLWVSHSKLGDIQLRLGNARAALESYRLSLDLAKRLADTDPTNADAQRDLSAAQQRLGDVQLKLGDIQAALGSYKLGLDLAKHLASADATNARAQRNLSAAQQRLGEVQMQLGDFQAALASYKFGLDLAKRLAEADPTNANAQHALSLYHSKLGNIQLRLGNARAALESYRLSLDLAKRLAEADPTNADAQVSLSAAQSLLGVVQWHLGDTQAALESYRLSLAIRQHLADADPTNAQAQRDLLIHYSHLGEALEQLGEFRQALEWYLKAQDLLKRLPSTADFAKDLLRLDLRAQVCRQAGQALTDPASALKHPAGLRNEVLTAVLAVHARGKQLDKILAVVELLARQDDAEALFQAACGLALCVPLTDAAREKEHRADRALTLLRQALESGFKDGARLQSDPDLEAVRPRKDFQLLLRRLEKK